MVHVKSDRALPPAEALSASEGFHSFQISKCGTEIQIKVLQLCTFIRTKYTLHMHYLESFYYYIQVTIYYLVKLL